MPNYVRRHWKEPRGDEHDDWGTSKWYFEVDDKGWVLRQVELYDSGVRRCYDKQHVEDEFGGLSETPLDLSEPEYRVISSLEFEEIWRPS